MSFREEVETMEKEVENAIEEEKSFAMELLEDSRRQNKRNFNIIIILIIALFLSNMGWLIYESQFDYVAEVSEQSTEFTEDSNIKQTMN